MKVFAILLALTISHAIAHENLEVDSMLSILAKPKLATQNDYYPIDAVRV